MLPSVWKEFLEHFDTIGEKKSVLHSLLRQSTLASLGENTAKIQTPNPGMATYLASRKTEIEVALSAFFKRGIRVEIVAKESPHKKVDAPLLSYSPPIEDLFARAGLNPKFTFDTFAVSPTNNVAFAAAQAVSNDPGRSYNPLFFYGGVGVGKTHLAQAAAKAILQKNNSARVLFCPGDRFTNELIESIQNKTTQAFRKKYRSLNLLIIDDIQFIAGKQTIQEEFFHTFNTIVGEGGQLILTSDRPPHDIKNLEDRLRSRFSGGLIVDLQPPDFELRTAILLIKAKEKNISIQIEAAKVIAEQIEDSRALEGTLLSVYARTLGAKEQIDLDVVDGFFRGSSTQIQVRISPSEIIRAVCSYYNIKQSVIKSSARSDAVAFPRQVVMFLLRRELKLKYEEIASLLKRRDHTTVLHGCEKIAGLCMRDTAIAEQIDRITKSLSISP